MNLNKPIQKDGIVHDGVVGDWHRWVGITIASHVLIFYFAIALFTFVSNRWFDGTWSSPLDPKYLIFLIPLGVLDGERNYRDDLKVNGKKRDTEV
jgi:hypothetical protein